MLKVRVSYVDIYHTNKHHPNMYKINIFLHLSPTKMRYGGELAGLYVVVVIYSSIAIAN